MASPEFLNHMSSSSSSSDESDDDNNSSSSSDENLVSSAAPPPTAVVEPLVNSNKPRIKLNIRMNEQPKPAAAALVNGHAIIGLSGGAMNGNARSSSDTSDDRLKAVALPTTAQQQSLLARFLAPSHPPESREDALPKLPKKEEGDCKGDIMPVVKDQRPAAKVPASSASAPIKVEPASKPPVKAPPKEDSDALKSSKDKKEDPAKVAADLAKDPGKVKVKKEISGDKPKPKKLKTGDSKDPAKVKKDPSKIPKKVGSKVSFKKPGLPLNSKKKAAAAAGTTTTNGESSPNAIKKKKKKKMGFKLPLHQDRTAPTVSASIVNSSDDDGFDAVAVSLDGKTKGAKPKMKKVGPARLRLPPIPSPGLVTGANTPAHVFDQAMAAAGYTTEERTKRPHRGSSVRRVVGDMFDSNVAFSLHFPDLVPKDLWYAQGSTNSNGDAENSNNSKTPLPDLLMRALEPKRRSHDQMEAPTSSNNGSRKRLRPWQFKEMVPKSLTIPYPRSYIDKQLEYVREVGEREKVIVAYQQRQEEIEEEYDEDENNDNRIENNVKIPGIPRPPSPPPLSELAPALNPDQFDEKHPIYIPKGKEHFVAHLDKDCFHITEGRYFDLYSNTIADPHFVGPNAPGVAGLTLSCGSGLATSTGGVGTSSSSSAPAAAVAVTVKVETASITAIDKPKVPAKNTAKPSKPSKPIKKKEPPPSPASPLDVEKKPSKQEGPPPTASSLELRKIMEEGGELAEQLKVCITRAAVYASRSGKHGRSFLAPNGKVYPDVSKAFAAHAGLKPCTRCKNNKQGAYHCRLRRKHKELDYDGSDSPAALAPLMLEPLENLILDSKKAG